MAKCSLTAREYIKNSFSPLVAVLPSEDVEHICFKNNLRFVELLQPFNYLQKHVYLADPSGSSISQVNLKLVFEDMNHQPVQPTCGKKMLSEVVLTSPMDQFISKKTCSGKGLDITLDLQPSTPWFESWRELFLQIQYPSDHEFTKHYVACIIVISSSSENPLDQLHRLSQYQHKQQHQNSNKFPKWFSPNILKFYLLLHDIQQGNIEKANSIYREMQDTYGNSHCYLLQINSAEPNQSELPKQDIWHKHVQQRRLYESGILFNSETSSGAGTPREDMGGFPARVSEGDSCESPDLGSHPLSPVPLFPEEKNDVFEAMPNDVPFLLNREALCGRSASATYGACLTAADIGRLQQFTHDFCASALVPHVERQIKYLSDVVANRSRSKSLLSATRRWLGGSKPPSGTVTNSVVYSPEATELQTRRLGDLCFMFGHYELAYNTYVTAKNDFKSDQAWLYFAGAQEMAALASFMHNSVDYPKRYFEGSLHTYLNVCKVYNFAIRLTLLSTEVLKYFSDYSDSAMTFLKMTSEESDLLSALMLEQAAHCFINMKTEYPRKYAFHMTLAGHRFGKAGQKNHSLRAYNQALQVYKDRCWVLAEDHIYFTMSKQALHLKERQQSLDAIMCLMNQVFKNTSSHQSALQQLAYFKEFLTIVKEFSQSGENDNVQKKMPINLSVPAIDPGSTKVLIGTPASDASLPDGWITASGYSFADEDCREERWLVLEKEMLAVVGSPKKIFKPRLHRMSKSTPNTVSPEVPINELVQFEFSVCNPLLISITVLNISPIFEYFDEVGNVIGEDCLSCDSLPGFNMPPESQDFIRLRMWPTRLGRFVVKGIKFGISLTSDVTSVDLVNKKIVVEGQQVFEIKGPRLNATLADKRSVSYGVDLRLNVRVIEKMPKLAVSLKEPPALMSCGEIFAMEVVFKNVGDIPLSKLHYASADPRAICFSNDSVADDQNALCARLSDQEQAICRKKNRAEAIPMEGKSFQPGETIKGCFWLHTPLDSGPFDVELLFYFEHETQPGEQYRLVRHLSSIFLENCLTLSASSRISSKSVSKTNSRHVQFCNIILHIKNNSDSEFSPDNVKLVSIRANSPSWKLLDNHDMDVSIGSDQNSRLYLSCVRLEEEGNLMLSTSYFTEHPNPPSCWKSFVLRERIKLDHLLAEPPPPNKAADYKPPPPAQREIDIKNMSKASDLDLVLSLLWKGRRNSGDMWGQHSVHLRRLGDSASVPLTADAKEAPLDPKDITFVRIIPVEEVKPPSNRIELIDIEVPNVIKSSINFTQSVEHDFSRFPLCVFAYSYTLFNCTACCLEAVVHFCSKDYQKQSSVQRIPSQQSNWNILPVAVTIKKVTLQPWQFQSVVVKSVVSFPGGYSIGATKVEIKSVTGSESWTHTRKDCCSHVWITDTSKLNS